MAIASATQRRIRRNRNLADQNTLFGDALPGSGYLVLARKYRPETFADLIGQDAMVTTLKNAFATDRIAQGYMLTGVRGVGKTTTARILSRAELSEKPNTRRSAG